MELMRKAVCPNIGDTQLSMLASNRYAPNAASMVGMFASILPQTDSKRKDYIDFVKSQIDYILGDNPAIKLKIDIFLSINKFNDVSIFILDVSLGLFQKILIYNMTLKRLLFLFHILINCSYVFNH